MRPFSNHVNTEHENDTLRRDCSSARDEPNIDHEPYKPQLPRAFILEIWRTHDLCNAKAHSRLQKSDICHVRSDVMTGYVGLRTRFDMQKSTMSTFAVPLILDSFSLYLLRHSILKGLHLFVTTRCWVELRQLEIKAESNATGIVLGKHSDTLCILVIFSVSSDAGHAMS